MNRGSNNRRPVLHSAKRGGRSFLYSRHMLVLYVLVIRVTGGAGLEADYSAAGNTI